MKIRVIKPFIADLGNGTKTHTVSDCERGKCSHYLGVIEIEDQFAIENDLVKRIEKSGVARILVYPKKRSKK